MSIKRCIIPSVGFLIALICFIINSIVNGYDMALMFQVLGCHALLFLMPLYELIFKKKFPLVLSAIITIHTICSLVCGTMFDFYEKIKWWDLFLHGSFGFYACFVAYYFYILCNAKSSKPFLYISYITGFSMGLAAMWEILEYSCDRILGTDLQRVGESIMYGKVPVADTMEDLIITLVGVLVFFLVNIIDKKLGSKFMNFYVKEIETQNVKD